MEDQSICQHLLWPRVVYYTHIFPTCGQMRARTHTCAHTTVTAVWDINQGYIRVVLMQADLTSHNTHTHAHTHTRTRTQ